METTTLEEPEIAAVAPEKPVVATLILKCAGMARQRITIAGRRHIDFLYRRGVGHIREYTDLATFHREEAAIREIFKPHFNIRTLIGSVSGQESIKAALSAFIADTTGHRPTKYAKLSDLRAMIETEMARLEKSGIGKEPEPPIDTAQPTAREIEIEQRRAFLRRVGEFEVRKLVEGYEIQGIQILNNFEGLMDAIIDFEFNARTMEIPKSFPAEIVVSNPPHSSTEQKDTSGEPDFSIMKIADLREIAKARGITETTRMEILKALGA